MAKNVHSTHVVICFIWAIQLLLMQYFALDTFNPLCYVKYLAVNSTSRDTWLMKRNNLAKHSGFTWLLLPDWCVRGVKSAALMLASNMRTQNNAKTQWNFLALHGYCQTGVNVVWSLQPWWSQLQQGVKWKLSTWNTMRCAHFICQTSLNLYFLMVTMATCYFMIQTCFWFCNLVTPRSQNKITIYPCLLNHLHLIPMPIKMPSAMPMRKKTIPWSDTSLTRLAKDLCNL